mmetsp:Transcript_14891/g.18687  ORF Transcript_14891/g.18687 Transcript_14891/m.18687 type:complete len:107 (+) Transcript_14891:759-1079(+)
MGDADECQDAMFILSSFLKGQHLNAKMNKLAAQVNRLVICGDSVREHEEVDEVHRGSYRSQVVNRKVYEDISQTYARFEAFLGSFIDKIDTDLMPGSQDFSNAYLP